MTLEPAAAFSTTEPLNIACRNTGANSFTSSIVMFTIPCPVLPPASVTLTAATDTLVWQIHHHACVRCIQAACWWATSFACPILRVSTWTIRNVTSQSGVQNCEMEFCTILVFTVHERCNYTSLVEMSSIVLLCIETFTYSLKKRYASIHCVLRFNVWVNKRRQLFVLNNC